jgi:hypothetical protein
MKKTVRNTARPARRSRNKSTSYRPADAFPFPEAQGKTLADLYLTTDTDMSCVTLAFDDNTDLVIDIGPCLSFSADYSDWKTGDQRVIKRRPRIRNT